MQRTLPFGIRPKTIARLAAGLLLASTLAAAADAAHMQHAVADGYDFPAPTLLSARIDGTTAYVSFRDNADGENGYQVVAFPGTDPQHYSVENGLTVQRPGVLGTGRAPTVSMDGLKPGQSYCFEAAAEEEYTDINTAVGIYDPSETYASPFSNMICAAPPAPAPAPVVDTRFDPKTAGVCVVCKVDAQPPAPTLPDFAVTRISGDQQVTQGFTKTYDVVVANLGAKSPSQVQVQIQVTGSLSYQQMVQTPAGFTCTGNGTITCVGPLGGYGDAPITTVADFQLQVHAANPGLGSISAYADPNNLITESNENNNAQSLAVTVK
jgi:hypothetical protein